MAKKHVPRQRKQKHRNLARNQRNNLGNEDTPNAHEILPEHVQEKEARKARMREELRDQGIKVSSKKSKRLDKYIENKLKKDENRELLAKLAETSVDTSLFASSRSLGHNRETKREALVRALKETKAGIKTDDNERLLFQERQPSADEDEGEDDIEDELLARTSASSSQIISSAPEPPATGSVGSGLKRPLDLGEDGRPKLVKRQKRGGVKSKISMSQPTEPERIEAESDDDAWNGFSSDEETGESASSSKSDGSDQPSEQDGSDVESEDGSEGSESEGSGQDGSSEEASSSEDEASDEDSDEDSDAEQPKRTQRSSAFKQWAHQARNQAMGYTPAESGTQSLQIPRPANFTPRPLEEDPLPLELQPTKNVDRKAHSVTVSRSPDIQEARLKLPVVAEEQRIMEAIHDNDIVVLCGSTGSGKTTQVPQFLFEAGYGSPDGPTPGLIGITQPRRVAAVSMSKRVGQELGNHSDKVAYQIRFEGTMDPKTAVKFMTDGVLLREVAQDIALRKYSAIIVDEAHERSVNTDILVGMLSRVVKLRAELSQEDPKIKPLKLIIMSATLRIEDMTQNPKLFKTPPPVLEVEGRQYPVTVHFSRRTQHDYVEEAFKKISRGHRKLPPGGILVFMTGQNEITELRKKLKKAFTGMDSATGPKVRLPANLASIEAEDIDFGVEDDPDVQDYDDGLVSGDEEEEDDEAEFEIPEEEGDTGSGPKRMHILPLYSLLPTKEQMLVFEPPPDGSRLVILATNVAETSLTIPGIRYVFDCGRSKERKYDHLTGVQSFEIGWISKASASQRSGRAGRTGPGHCYRLYSSAVYERDFQEFAEPELLRMPIEGIVLQLKAMNLQNVVNFPFPTPPDTQSLRKAERLLNYLSAINSSGKVTQIGKTMSIFPLAPRFSRILLVGHQFDCIQYTIALVAGLSAAEVFLPESHAIPQLATKEDGEETFRTNADVIAETRQANARRAYNAVHKNFCFLDDKADAIKLLQVVGEFAHEPTEAWCESHFIRYKTLKEILQLRQQITELLRTNIAAFAGLSFQAKLPKPSEKQITALKQMVAAGFIDQVAIRNDKAPTPLEMGRKPRRAIDVAYIPLTPLAVPATAEPSQKAVYLHPSSPMAHLSPGECPDYVIYSHLQKASGGRTRMHTLTDVKGGQLASLAKGTPLISYGKPIKEVKLENTEGGKLREVWVVPSLNAEGKGGWGWPLPARKVTQRRIAGNWVVQ
ncbi:putative ATP-dependent RNA helicase DHR1 [Diaporthe australafricana]|uniref:RNA helicase n=1 Tax=Diaporthe australafricana TaxID=127596 RepID=A0ABR3Y0W0_9PEZI